MLIGSPQQRSNIQKICVLWRSDRSDWGSDIEGKKVENE